MLANGGPHGGYPRLDHTNTLPVWLQAAGYYTAHIGKYLNNYGVDSPAPPPGWSRWFGLIDPTTYKLFDYTGERRRRGGELRAHTAEEYQTDVLAAEAEKVLRSRAGAGKPFFLTVAPVAPHLERIATASRCRRGRRPATRGRSPTRRCRSKPAYDEADVADKPAHIRRLPRLSPATKATRVLDIYRARLASLLAVDDLVERLVTALADTGQLGRTVIIFTSDNGFLLGEHRVPDQKYFPYEESIRVPLIIRGGGFPAGATAAQPVSNIDLAPTIVALTGARARRVMDGQPLLPLALDPQQGKDRTLLVEGFGAGASKPPSARCAIRGTSTPSRPTATASSTTCRPTRTSCTAATPRRTWPVRTRLATRLAQLRTCRGPACL